MTGLNPFEPFGLPPPWPESLLPRIRANNASAHSSFVVLDDDPLGGQCLHDIDVFTDMDSDRMADEIELGRSFLLLTNTRAMTREGALRRSQLAASAVLEAAVDAGNLATPLWRSDSTLRGHFWWEMQAFAEEYPGDGMPEPVFVFVPYFGEAGRFTLDDTQYVLDGDGALTPVAETEFARDPAFTFSHSHLPSWLEAHTDGHFEAGDVLSISLQDLRTGGPARVEALLAGAPKGSAVIVNAADDRDLEVFVVGLQAAEEAGGYFLCSGAAPFIRVRLGQEKRPLLCAEDLDLNPTAGGLTVVGSYIARTSDQLTRALADPTRVAVELPTDFWSHDVSRVYGEVAGGLEEGRDVILYTSRDHDPEAASAIANVLATVVSNLVSDLERRPRYLLVKGGSTASHLATQALGVRRATVLGQLLPGVPVWRLGEESKWPGLPFVIFAGNVGTEDSLAEALRILHGS